MKTAYSEFNLLKYHVLKILYDNGETHWEEIYDSLPLIPKPKKSTFLTYMNNLYKKGDFKSIIIEKNGKYRRKKIYSKRRYVLKVKRKKKINKKTYYCTFYRISKSGITIFEKLHNLKITGRKLKIR